VTATPPSYRTIDEALIDRAATTPDKIAFTFLEFDAEDDYTSKSLTFTQLDRRVEQMARSLIACHPDPGSPVLLAHPAGLEFVVSFLGCLRAGLVAVPAPLPVGRRGTSRLVALAQNAGARLGTTQAGVAVAERLVELMPELRLLSTDALTVTASVLPTSGSEVALLQYTSGSTSDPKGVVVTQLNVVHNQQSIADAFGHSPDTTIVSWLPHFHDMGLACLLQPIYCGGRSVIFAPEQFLRSPARWLRAIADFAATTSGAPDFAYALVADLPAAALDGIDLSSWQVAFNGSEPVRRSTIDSFVAAHRDRGIGPDTVMPCYGLAESTLLVTAKPLGTAPRLMDVDTRSLAAGLAVPATDGESIPLMASGVAVGQTVVVVDREGNELDEGRVGEIWTSGPSVCTGYLGLDSLSQEIFRALVPGRPDRRFLRTGDLGFLSDGHLFVTGRVKDLIIIRGTNHYPQDIEATVAASHPAVRARGVVAFAENDGAGEWLTVVCETPTATDIDTDGVDRICQAVVNAVVRDHGIRPEVVALVAPGSVPMTTSGKPRRAPCRDAIAQGALVPHHVLDRRHESAGTAEPKTDNLGVWTRAYLDRLHDGPTEPGRLSTFLDSLQALTFCRDLERRWGVRLDLPDLLELQSVDELLTLLEGLPPADCGPGPDDGAERGAPFPLTPAQEGIWLLDQRAGDGNGWSIRRAFGIVGLDDPARLAAALDALVARHAALRTVIVGDDRPRQQTQDVVPSALTVWDDVVAPSPVPHPPDVDPRVGPLLRADLYPTGAGAHVLVLQVHHLAVDLLSAAQLLDELSAALDTDTDRLTTPSATGFRDHAVALARVASASDDYWAATLGGAGTGLDLQPANVPTAEPVTRVAFQVDARTVARIEALARSAGATPYMVHLAVFALVTMQHSGRRDVVVGSPVSTRVGADAWDVVGCFMQPGAVRVRVADDDTFTDVLATVRRQVIDGLTHLASAPAGFATNLVWDRAMTPEMFDAVLLWQQPLPGLSGLARTGVGQPGATCRVGGADWELLDTVESSPRFAIELGLSAVGSTVDATLTGDGRRLTTAAARRWTQRFETTLAAAIDAPGAPLPVVLELPEHDRALSRRWGTPPSPRRPDPLPLHESMFRWAQAQPDVVAVQYEDTAVTYGELADAVREGADVLAATVPAVPTGTDDEQIVAVLVHDGLDLVTSLYSVLAAGRAFVCPGLRTPTERIMAVLSDARVAAVVVADDLDPALLAELGSLGVPVLPCSAAGRLSAPDADHGRPGERGPVDPASAAFVAYTSGTTGTPKGVVQSHASFAAFLAWQAETFDLRPGRRIASWSASSYDAAYCEIFGALCHGATLWTAPAAVRQDPRLLLAALTTADVHVWQVVPSFLATTLVDIAAVGAPRSLTHIFCAGEVLAPALCAEVLQLMPTIVLHNLYGPSEAVLATFHRVTVEDTAKRAVPLGTPIEGRRILLLDGRGDPMPVGAVGHLHIASDHLARGYLNSPALTAARFVPDPGTPSGRMYRTGDLARWTAEGELLFVGRVDGQVKIRGMRIELSECEAVLNRHRLVTLCAIRTRGSGPSLRLEAHVVRSGDVEAAELRAHMRRSLPQHMVPSRFEFRDTLPTTRTGKIDRSALDVHPSAAGRPSGARLDQGSPTRDRVADVWADVLEVPIAPDTDFFATGGQSIDGIRVTNRVRAEFGIDVALQEIFDAPVLADYADEIHAIRIAAASTSPTLHERIAQVVAMDDAEVAELLTHPTGERSNGRDEQS
jgi:amino acid adenylation domain-containing protein